MQHDNKCASVVRPNVQIACFYVRHSVRPRLECKISIFPIFLAYTKSAYSAVKRHCRGGLHWCFGELQRIWPIVLSCLTIRGKQPISHLALRPTCGPNALPLLNHKATVSITIRLSLDCCWTAYHTSRGQQGHSDVIHQWPLTARPLRSK